MEEEVKEESLEPRVFQTDEDLFLTVFQPWVKPSPDDDGDKGEEGSDPTPPSESNSPAPLSSSAKGLSSTGIYPLPNPKLARTFSTTTHRIPWAAESLTPHGSNRDPDDSGVGWEEESEGWRTSETRRKIIEVRARMRERTS